MKHSKIEDFKSLADQIFKTGRMVGYDNHVKNPYTNKYITNGIKRNEQISLFMLMQEDALSDMLQGNIEKIIILNTQLFVNFMNSLHTPNTYTSEAKYGLSDRESKDFLQQMCEDRGFSKAMGNHAHDIQHPKYPVYDHRASDGFNGSKCIGYAHPDKNGELPHKYPCNTHLLHYHD